MRIAHIAPPFESVPPQLCAATERVISALSEDIVARRYDVTLVASGEHATRARLVPCAATSSRVDGGARDTVAFTTMEFAGVFDQSADFDASHNHADYLAFPFARESRTPVVTATHRRLDLPEIKQANRYFGDAALASISDSPRAPVTDVGRVAAAYDGVDRPSAGARPPLHEAGRRRG